MLENRPQGKPTQGKDILIVTSILLLITGSVFLVWDVFIWVKAYTASLSATEPLTNGWLYYGTLVTNLLMCVFCFPAAVLGIRSRKDRGLCDACIRWGSLVFIMAALNTLICMVGGSLDLFTALVMLAVPGVHVYGAKLWKEGKTV